MVNLGGPERVLNEKGDKRAFWDTAKVLHFDLSGSNASVYMHIHVKELEFYVHSTFGHYIYCPKSLLLGK